MQVMIKLKDLLKEAQTGHIVDHHPAMAFTPQKEESVNEGVPFPQDTPNEFAYLEYKRYAYKKRGQYKKDALKHVRSDGDVDSSRLFLTATKWWMEWAKKKNKAWTNVKDKKKFGRALIVMMVKDDLVFSKKAWKKNNKITTVKEEAPPGMEKVVKALKKKKDIDNPYAVAWAMYNKKK